MDIWERERGVPVGEREEEEVKQQQVSGTDGGLCLVWEGTFKTREG